MKKPLPEIPAEIRAALRRHEITPTSFGEKNDILRQEALQREVGYRKMDGGTYLVSMTCPMPGITQEMIEWWFWWHPKQKARYQVWFPGAHYSVGYPGKQADYFERKTRPPFRNNTQYPDERIGGTRMPLRIDFVTPEEFGFSRDAMADNGIPLIVCGHVGVWNGLIWHTEMAHIFKQTSDGLFLISRFWMGEKMKSAFLRTAVITEKLANGMAEHCCVEYRNLCEILPELYSEYALQ